MIEGIEVQVISRLLTTESQAEVDTLLGYDTSYFNAYKKEFEYIQDHNSKYNSIPSVFDFTVQFPDFVVVQCTESMEYLSDRLSDYKQYLILVETFNKVKDLGQGDVKDTWRYIEVQCEKASGLNKVNPMNIVAEAPKRAQQILDYSRQKKIPTGFPEIDKFMYGGLSIVEELLVLIARTNAGKSWVCTRMMESAQRHGFPVAYYSPEMQSAYLGTRFDTWRAHFENNCLYKGDYSQEYKDYLDSLSKEETPAYVIEDKDFPNGVSVRTLGPFVKKHGIRLLVIDGISYMMDDEKATRDQEKYKNIATGLFKLSKRYGCAVVLVMQANREVKSKDDKGESIPDLYNAEGSDHPGRVATQAFGIRQIFDKHVLDIKLLKSRMANNQNPVVSYAWDVNTGNVNYIPNSDNDTQQAVMPTAVVDTSSVLPARNSGPDPSSLSLLIQDDDDEVEF